MNGIIKKIFFLLALCLTSQSILADNATGRAYQYYLQAVKYEQSLYGFEARSAFLKAIALDPNNSGYLTHYAWFAHWFGFEVRSVPSQTWGEDPRNAAWFAHSYEFNHEATVAFGKALLHPPQGQETILNKGLAWDQVFMGNLASATDTFQHLYPSPWLRSNYRNAINEAGILENNVIETKIKQLKFKLAHDPNNLELQKDLFDNYVFHNDYKNAVIIGKNLIANNKIDNFTRLKYARALFNNKQFIQAEIYYQALMRRLPRNAFLSYEWATKLIDLDQYDAAYAMLTRSLSNYPSAEAKQALAKLKALKGNCNNSFALLSSMLAMADTYRICHQYQLANSYYQTVLQEYPYNTDALWGVLLSTAASHHYAGNRLAYDNWVEVPYFNNRSLLQYQLADYYQSPMLALNGDFYENSKTFSRQDWGAAYDFYAFANIRLNLAYNFSRFAQNRFDTIDRNMVQLEFWKLFSDNWQLNGGISDKKYTNDKNSINGNVLLLYTASPNLYANLEYRHIDIIDTEPPYGTQIYNYIIAIGAVGLNIQTNDISGTINYRASRQLAFWAKAIYGDYSDGNSKTQANFEASYQFINIPQVKILYDYFYLNFAQPAPIFTQNGNSQSAYYDPINFQVHVGKLRIEHYFTDKFFAGIEDGVSFFPQNGVVGNAVIGYVDYKILTHLALRVNAQYYYQNDSIARHDPHTGSFWAKGINFSLIFKQ